MTTTNITNVVGQPTSPGGTLIDLSTETVGILDSSRVSGLATGILTVPIRNESGATILKGKSLASAGKTNGRILVVLADKDDPARRPALCAAQADIPNLTDANGIRFGQVDGLDTGTVAFPPFGLANSDQLILGNNGAFIRPSPENVPFTGEQQNIGQVIGAGASNGTVDFNYGEGLLPSFIPFPDDSEGIPIPESRVIGQSTRILQTVLEGGALNIARSFVFNRVHVRVTSVIGTPTITLQIFQVPNGRGGSGAKRIATVQAFAPVTGNNILTPVNGPVHAEPGILYALFGRDSAAGSVTLRTYQISGIDLLNQDLPSGVHATNFTTTIAATTAPATFDPLTEAAGSVLDLTPVFRFKRV